MFQDPTVSVALMPLVRAVRVPRARERPQVLNGGWQRSGRSEAIAVSTTNFCIVVHTFSVYYRRAEKTLPNLRGARCRGSLILEGGRGIDLDLD